MVFWAFPKQISTLKRENLTENWKMGMRNWFLGKVPHNSDLLFLRIRCKLTYNAIRLIVRRQSQ